MKLLKFYAEWCGPCKGLTMIINGAKDKINIPIEEYDIDNEMFMAQDYKVRSVPTLVLVDDKNQEIKRSVGLLTEEKLLEFLKG
jgi:thioredoxin 1